MGHLAHLGSNGPREQGSQARLVALSANAMPDAVARARAAGFDDYWTKPIDFASLRGEKEPELTLFEG